MVGVRFTDLIAGTHQINLFDDTQELIRLYQAIDSVKKQYGEKYLIRATGYTENKNCKPGLINSSRLSTFKCSAPKQEHPHIHKP